MENNGDVDGRTVGGPFDTEMKTVPVTNLPYLSHLEARDLGFSPSLRPGPPNFRENREIIAEPPISFDNAVKSSVGIIEGDKRQVSLTTNANIFGYEIGNDELHALVFEWMDYFNFLQLYSGFSQRTTIDLSCANVKDADAPERNSYHNDDMDEDNDEDENFNLTDDSEQFANNDYEMHENDELFESNVDPYVEFVGTPNMGKEKNEVSNIQFEDKLESSNFEVDCMDSNDDGSVNSGEDNDHTRWPIYVRLNFFGK